MKSKERPWVLTKEDIIHEVKKDHEGPKSQKEGKKERNNNNNKEKRRGTRSSQRTCSKKKDPGQARGYVARRINIKDIRS